MTIHLHPDTDSTLRAIAAFFIAVAREAIGEQGRFNVVLSGGSTPRRLYEMLSSDYKEAIKWEKVFFFFGDERNVPAEDKDNNGRMARESLFDPLHIARQNIFYIPTSLQPAAAATAYETSITKHFDGAAPVFDLILLGLGDNSHTASLFPHTNILEEHSRLVAAVYVDEVKSYRISMTAPLINQAKQIAFLVTGISKAAAVRQVIEGEKNVQEHPAQLIVPARGELHWFMDAKAGSQLSNQGA